MKHIVFIPGIMGSELFEGTLFGGTKRWFTLKLQNFSANRLKLIPGKVDKIRPGAPIDYGVRFLGNTVQRSIVYASILDQLSDLKIGDYQLHPYGYDWRKDLWDTCNDLDQLIKKFKNEEIYIVAHSMGGLLAHTYCQIKNNQGKLPNIKKVITIGTPWQGSTDAFKTLYYGLEKGWTYPDPKVTRDISRTFPSCYQLLPSTNYCSTKKYLKSKGKELRWLDCIDLVQNFEGCNVKSINALNQRIHQSLVLSWPGMIEHYNIVGVGQGAIGVLDLGDNGQSKIETPVDGDGVVPLDSALPIFNTNKTVYTHASHQGLVLHQPVLDWVKGTLEYDQPQDIEGILDFYLPKTDWIMEKIDCPVEVSVRGEEETVDQPADDITKHSLGETTYLIYNSEKPAIVEVEAYDEGRTSIETIKVVNNKITTVTKFPSVDADPSRKTIIDLTFTNNEPVTRVYTEVENEPINAVEIRGVTVEVPEKTYSEPPSTRIKLIGDGQGDGQHFDESGVNISFKVKEKIFPLLEIRYRVNNGIWKRYDSEFKLTLENGLVQGKNIIEYYSSDVYENIEKVKKKIFYIEPKPKILYRILLNPDLGGILSFEEFYEGVKKYHYDYKVGNLDSKQQKYEGSIHFKPYEDNLIFVQATDMFDRKSNWNQVDLSFNELAEKLWSEEGFEGIIQDIIELLPHKNQDLIAIFAGKSEKNASDQIPKTAKTLTVKYIDTEYIIDLMPKLEIYLDYHSEKIKREEENVKISFIINDSEDNQLKDIKPSVKYSLIPVKDPAHDIKNPVVSNNGKGLYTFNLPVKHLSKEVKKIKIEFRDASTRIKPIDTRTFKLE